jgi:hypothetical protein
MELGDYAIIELAALALDRGRSTWRRSEFVQANLSDSATSQRVFC